VGPYRGGDNEGRRRESEQGASRLGSPRGELLFHASAVGVAQVPDSSKEKAHAQNEKQVREDGPEHGGLDNLNLAIAKGDNADNQFNGVSERRIQEPAQSFTQSHGDFFRRKREDRGEGDDGEEVEDEDSVGVPF